MTTETERKPLTWEPERYSVSRSSVRGQGKSGDFYCSPACGSDCTWERHERAVAESDLLALAMGEGWITRVWENMGWHWSVESPNRYLKVHPSIRNHVDSVKLMGFTAFLGSPGVGGKWAEGGKTPHEAIANVRAKAQAELEGMAVLVELGSL